MARRSRHFVFSRGKSRDLSKYRCLMQALSQNVMSSLSNHAGLGLVVPANYTTTTIIESAKVLSNMQGLKDLTQSPRAKTT
jgi:hypothetical protein